MRVLHIAPFLWSGAGQVITSLCESQATQHAVAVVTTGRSDDQRDWPSYRTRLARLGAPHTRIDFFHRDSETFWSGVERLHKLVAHWRPDIVHTHAGVPACAAAAVRQSGLEFTLVNHVYSWGHGRPEWMNTMDLSGHRQADVVICSADAYERRLVDGGVSPHRIVKLQWGLAPVTLAGVRTRLHRRDRSPHIGLVGRIEPRKGQLELIRGFALVKRRWPAAMLELVGPVADDGYGARVRQEIATRDLQQSVKLRGHVRNVPAIVAGWDLCVSLSSDEGQGLAILEAMALGVPVAARPVAGIEDFFRPGVNGIGIRSTGPRDVAVAIALAIDDDGSYVRTAKRARTEIRKSFSWDRTVRAIHRVYERSRPGTTRNDRPD